MSYGTDEPTQHTFSASQLGRPSTSTPTPAYRAEPAGREPMMYGTPQQRGPQEYSTASFSPPPGFPPVPPPRKKKRGRGLELAAAGVVVLIALGIGAAWAVASRSATSAASSSPAARQPASVNCEHGQLPNGACAGGEPLATPVPADFQLSLKITDKRCFGSAGCNVTFEVELGYHGRVVESNSSWDVTYDVTGGEDPFTSTLTVEFDGSGSPARYQQRSGQTVQTAKSSAELKATVTAVSEA